MLIQSLKGSEKGEGSLFNASEKGLLVELEKRKFFPFVKKGDFS